MAGSDTLRYTFDGLGNTLDSNIIINSNPPQGILADTSQNKVAVNISPVVSLTVTPAYSPTPIPSPAETITPAITATDSPTPIPPSVDSTTPNITITYPANGAAVNRNSTITVTVSVSDNQGGSGIAKVEYYINNSLKYSSSLPPYSFTWKLGGKPGVNYETRARVVDKSGNFAEDKITIFTK